MIKQILQWMERCDHNWKYMCQIIAWGSRERVYVCNKCERRRYRRDE